MRQRLNASALGLYLSRAIMRGQLLYPYYNDGMALPYFPLKPRVMKAHGFWRVFLPNQVFAESSVGTYHGPFESWGEALHGALGISSALNVNMRMRHSEPFQIGMVD